jgi:F0F1-type ATP synthase membrane subunit c/vacuolar-type H+-ATPase subunit K
MKVIGVSLLAGVIGYAAGVLIGIALVNLLSSNQHDRSQEAVITGFFFAGPVAAVLSFVVTLIVKLVR